MTTDSRAAVSVIGLGPMGAALTGAFLDRGHRTTVWSRSLDKADELVAKGAARAATVAETVAASSLVVVCVLDHRAMTEIVKSLCDSSSAGRVIVNLTSGTPAEAHETAACAAELGIDYLDGAVMTVPALVGRPETLIFYGGPSSVFEAHERTLASIAGHGTYLGEDVGLPSLYDVALLGLMWTAWMGLLHSLALVGTAKVTAADFLPYVSAWFEQVIAAQIPVIAAQVDRGRYPDPDSTLGMHAVAIEHLVDTSRAQNVDIALPEFIKAHVERAILRGHAGDGFAGLIEAMRADRSS